MSSAFEGADILERGSNASQVPQGVVETMAPDVGRTGNGRESDDQASATAGLSTYGDHLLDPEQDTGQIGLARLKSFDPRFNFYPAFPAGTSMVLDSLALKIFRIMIKIEIQRKKIRTRHHVEPCGLRRRKRAYKKWESMTTELEKKVQEYNITFVNAKMVNEYERPQEDALKTLKGWLTTQHNIHSQMYNDMDVDAFRMLEPRRGPIEKFVHETLPATTATAIFLRPFRARSSKTEDFEYHGYSERVLNRITGVVSLLCTSALLVIPMGLLVYVDTKTGKLTIVLMMGSLISLLAQMTEKDEGRRMLLVCACLATLELGSDSKPQNGMKK